MFHWVQAHLCPCDTEDTIAVGKDSNHEAMINNVGSTVCEILVSAPALYSDASSATDRGPDISDLRVLWWGVDVQHLVAFSTYHHPQTTRTADRLKRFRICPSAVTYVSAYPHFLHRHYNDTPFVSASHIYFPYRVMCPRRHPISRWAVVIMFCFISCLSFL